MEPIYHTSLGKQEPPRFQPLTYWKSDREPPIRRAMAQDLCAPGVPDEWKLADVLYCEPSWPRGYPKFEHRAMRVTAGWKSYIEGLGRLIETLPIPAVVLGGPSFRRYLPDAPLILEDLDLHGNLGKVWAYCYGYNELLDSGVNSAEAILCVLADNFDTVLDPSCGFGRSAYYFANRGKGFIASDLNPQCIGYIAAQPWVLV